MKSITYLKMDVHSINCTLCCYSVEDDRYFAEIEIKPGHREVLEHVNRIQSQRGVGDCALQKRETLICADFSLRRSSNMGRYTVGQKLAALKARQAGRPTHRSWLSPKPTNAFSDCFTVLLLSALPRQKSHHAFPVWG